MFFVGWCGFVLLVVFVCCLGFVWTLWTAIWVGDLGAWCLCLLVPLEFCLRGDLGLPGVLITLRCCWWIWLIIMISFDFAL